MIHNRSIFFDIVVSLLENKLINRIVKVIIEFHFFLGYRRLAVGEAHLQLVFFLKTQSIIILFRVFDVGKTLLYLVGELHLDPAEKLYLNFHFSLLQISQIAIESDLLGNLASLTVLEHRS